VTESDFEHALSDVTPAFGIADVKELSTMLGNGIINEWTLFKEFESALTKSIFNREQKNMSILLHGPRGCGKTAILANVGLEYNIPFVKLISPSKLITMSENQRINEISSIFNDASRSNDSVILIDDIERVIEYVDIGPRFSNQMLQCLLVMINKATNNKLTIILTSSMDDNILSALGFNFDKILRIPVPDDTVTKEIIVELLGYGETSAPMMDGIKVPIKRFYM
jgi:vesicle-fusing ATPase